MTMTHDTLTLAAISLVCWWPSAGHMVILHIKQKTRHTQRAPLIQRTRNVSFNIYTFSSRSLDDSLCSANCFSLSPIDWAVGGHWTGHFTVMNIRECHRRNCEVVKHSATFSTTTWRFNCCSTQQLFARTISAHLWTYVISIRVTKCGKRSSNL